MTAYADTSFLGSAYLTQAHSRAATAILQSLKTPLPYTALQVLEFRNAMRLAVFRGEIDQARRDTAFADVANDLAIGLLATTTLHWADMLREAERLSASHSETLGSRSLDLLHVAAALTLGAREFLTFDTRQAALAKAAGLRVRP